MNRLAESIGALCSEHVILEKWLLVPSLRMGHQWMDAVTRSGRPLLNVHVKTLTGMALDLAGPEIERRGLTFLRGLRAEVLAGILLARPRGNVGYLSRMGQGPGLAKALTATLNDLRLGGIISADLEPGLFEVGRKGRELISLLSAYEEELGRHDLVDRAGVLRLATEMLRRGEEALSGEWIVAMPRDMEEELLVSERALWEAVPQKRRFILEVDEPCRSDGGETDSTLLAWVSRPADAPPPTGDGTVEFFRAVGEANELREVIRRCLARGIPFDEVEILHTDPSTYVSLAYEVCSAIATEPGGEAPVTFAEGIPVRYSRPGRALAGWISWIREDFPQSTLVRMLQDGLLSPGSPEADAAGFSRLASLLRALPIGKGRERYLAVIDAELASLRWRSSMITREENGDKESEKSQRLEKRLLALRSLRDLVEDLLSFAPTPAKDGRDALSGAISFLERRARGISEFDEYGRMRLLDDIAELSSSLQLHGEAVPDIADWLAELAASARVEGKGPRPGRLYVAPIAAGGHSGRPHTFILGMDDGRFPGAGLQDPLLLDRERAAISGGLPTAAARLEARLGRFAYLAARMRGRVTLSYCCHDLTDDRDMFPSPVFLSAYRIISGNREGAQEDLLKWLPQPVCFAPRQPELCMDASAWWLCRLCGEEVVEDPRGTVCRAFPHLGRGLEARLARLSDRFTVYDGYVPQAGIDLDPTGPEGPALSASRLEMLGRCPLEYFFAYILDIKPPEEYGLDPSRWLEPTEKGSLLHVVFHRFLLHLHREGGRPVLERDWDTLREMLDAEISAWARMKPPPNREVYEAESGEMRRTARIFLQEEEVSCRDRHPLYFEVAIGLEAEGEGNAIDSPHPVEIRLPGGKTMRARGYIDRVDELESPGSMRFAVCDYKTGSSNRYSREDPFRQGRCVQNVIYNELAGARLAQCHPGAEVASFQYFFPNTREHGERIEWDSGTLAGGLHVLERLCEMLSLGCFPFTDDDADISISDYKAAFGDAEAGAKAAKRMLASPGNEALNPLRELRGYGVAADE